MSEVIFKPPQNLPDVSAFLESLTQTGDFFARDRDIFVARAPGRLDVMGGIADYSGSLVLQMPIREAALVALQKDDSRVLQIISRNAEGNHRAGYFKINLADFERDSSPISYQTARGMFQGETAWAAYLAGAFLVLERERGIIFHHGARILLDSAVPEGKGVSSSAAIEVAAMKAIAAAFEITIEPRDLALLCQKVENLIVGAPCGVMDQMTAAKGAKNELLALVCQPAELQKSLNIPDEIAFWGIDSGVRHSVGAGDYGSVRTGAFIGYRIIAEIADLKIEETSENGVVKIHDSRWHNYLTNLTPAEFEKSFAAHLPLEISGADFLHRYQGISDSVTRVDPAKTYPVKYPTAHPIYENARVRRFAELLTQPIDNPNLIALGELMFASHRSYSACGLGSSGTDLLIKLVRESAELVGAKITGGGSGGTIAVLGRPDSANEIRRIAAQYERLTNYRPMIFSGSSNGAAEFGFLKFSLDKI